MQKPLHNFFTVPNLEEGKLESVLPRLSPESDTELKNMLERINKIAEVFTQKTSFVKVKYINFIQKFF